MLDSAVRSNGLKSISPKSFWWTGCKRTTISSRLRPWARNPKSSSCMDSLFFLQLMGCLRSQGIWLSGLLVQPVQRKESANGDLLPILRSCGLTGSLRLFRMIKESVSPGGLSQKISSNKRDSTGHASEQSTDGTNSAGKRRGPTAVDCCPGPIDGALPASGPRSAGCADWRP